MNSDLHPMWVVGFVDKAKGQKDPNNFTARFRVRKLADLRDKIIPFFDQYSLNTKKKVEYLQFRKLCYLLSDKIHLTESGFPYCLNLAKNLPYEINPQINNSKK